jgi:hypothetical protein
MIGAAMRSMTFSGTGVGPGVKSRFFMNQALPARRLIDYGENRHDELHETGVQRSRSDSRQGGNISISREL